MTKLAKLKTDRKTTPYLLFRLMATAFAGTAIAVATQAQPTANDQAISPVLRSPMNESSIDQLFDRSLRELLAQLKGATSIRVADRHQNIAYFAPEMPLRFDKKELHRVCSNVARALFNEQTRVRRPPRPTVSVEGDGIDAATRAADKIYPQCRQSVPQGETDGTLSRTGGWANRDYYLSKPVLQRGDTRFYFQDDAVFLVRSRPAKRPGERTIGVLMAAGSDGTCAVLSDEASIGMNGQDASAYLASFAQIDGKLAQLFLIGEPLTPEDLENSKRLDALNLSPKDFQYKIFHQSPNKKPHPGEKMLIVNLPPYSPLMPPIAERIKDWQPTNDPYSFPRFSKSIIPTCFIYFR